MLKEGQTSRIAFISYYKGEYSIHTLERKEPLHLVASADLGAPGPIIDFQAPLQHTLVSDNQRKKKPFEKMFLEGRPPVNVGVTSNGDVFGGSEISFGDVTGDKQFNVFIASISQYRTIAASYVNLASRFQYALQGYSQTTFFYGAGNSGVYYDPAYQEFIDRDNAQATRTVRGGSALGIYPISRYRRVQFSGGFVQLREQYNDPGLRRARGAVSAGALRADALQQRLDDPARRRIRPGDDGVPRVRTARGQYRADRVRRRRPRSAACCRARPSMPICGTTCGSAPTVCSRRASKGSRAGASIPISRISAATRSCAATTTCSSPGRTPCSPTPNCASR